MTLTYLPLVQSIEMKKEMPPSLTLRLTCPRKEVDYKAVYLQDEWEVSDTLNVVLGARYDTISNAENKATFKVGAVKNFSKLFNLRFNFAQGYRTPDIREMYINKQTPNGLQQGAEVVGL